MSLSADELRNQRDLSFDKTEKLAAKLKTAIDGRNKRLVAKGQNEMSEQFSRFEQLHIQYATRAKQSLTSEGMKEVYDSLSAVVLETDELAWTFMEDMTAAREAAAVERNRANQLETDRKLKRTLISDFDKEAEMLATHMSELVARMAPEAPEPWTPDIPVMTAEVVFCEKRFEAAKAFMEQAAGLEDDEEARSTIKARSRIREMEFRQRMIQFKSAGWRPEAGSNLVSPNTSRSSVSEPESEKFKNKKIDYPKFSGEVRQYLTFKRDFEEVVKKPGKYTPSEMSLILRNQCLQGQIKVEYQNLTDFEKLESKLDEEFLDMERVVDIVTQQLTDSKPVRWDDYAGFIKLVDTVEMGHLDLTAVGNRATMNNPMTVRLIESKCPDWVVKALMAAKEETGVEQGKEFDYLLPFLIRKRKEARRLLRLKECQQAAQQSSTSQNQQQQQKNRSAGIHAVGGQSQGGQHQQGGGQQHGGGGQQRGAQTGSGGGPGGHRPKCTVPGCTFNKPHRLTDCRAFMRLDASQKGEIILTKSLCVFCFGSSHAVANCHRKGTWKECDVQNCGRWHSRLLHGAVVPGLALAVRASASAEQNSGHVLLLCQRIPTAAGPDCLTFWDHGATTALVTFDYAEKAGLEGVDCTLELTVVGDQQETLTTKIFVVPLIDRQGNQHDVCAFGMKRITSDMKALGVDQAVALFDKLQKKEVDPPTGAVDLLVGMSYVNLLPVRGQIVEKLAIYTSQFGTGYLLGGVSDAIYISGERDHKAQCVSHTEIRKLKMKPLDFFAAEAVGSDVPKRCKNCKGCKECDFKVRSLTWTENQELAEVEKGLSLDTVAKKWTAVYPFAEDPAQLKNNYNQAYSFLERLEKRLKKTGQLQEFDTQMQETIKRGIFREVTKKEMEEYNGPINYITIVETFKPGPHSTTPIRLCMNSSLKYAGISLNDLLMKGPSALNDLFGVTLGFRRHKVGFAKDLSKFYQSVLACERDQHLRRVLWRGGEADKLPSVYVTTTVNFGDKPAGCIAQTAVRETAKLYRHIGEQAAELIEKATFCDDTLGGGETREEAELISRQMDEIVEMGGFAYKTTVMSGDQSEAAGGRKVLGLGWDEQSDKLFIDVKVNCSPKRKGIRSEPNLELSEVGKLLPAELTKRLVWRIVLGQYDLLGLTSVFMIRLKLIMRELSMEDGVAVDWDQAVPDRVREAFIEVLEHMERLQEVKFPRCVVPEAEDKSEEPILLCFVDGSTSAFCSLVYGRWKVLGGGYACRLIAGKCRVAPLKKLTVPRLELQGAVTGVRLTLQVEEFLGIRFARRFFFTDSSAVLGMIRGDSAAYQEFVSNRVGEIKSKTEPLKEWFWVATDQNLADLGTRNSVTPEDMMEDKEYQIGKDWMRGPEEKWPVNQSFSKPPEEEMKKVGAVCLTAAGDSLVKYERFQSFSKLQRVIAYVFHFIEAIKRKMISGGLSSETDPAERSVDGSERGPSSAGEQDGGAPEAPESDGLPRGVMLFILNQQDLEAAELFLLARGQEGLRKELKDGKYRSLLPRFLTKKDPRGLDVELVVVAGRLGDNLRIGYDKTELPLLERKHPVAKLLMREAHETDHSGLDRTVMRSRNTAWITQARSLAKVVRMNCFTCRLRAKNLEKQIMAPLPASRLPPAPVFHNTAVDLFGPIQITDSVKRRVSGNCWGVIFCCTVTSAIHLEVSEDYSCDSFLLCLKRFLNLRGTPARFQSDPGSQLMAAAAELSRWSFKKILEWTAEQKVEWHRAPTASQHFNGMAEAMIRVTKQQLVEMLKEKKCTKGELDTLMSDVAYLVNSRPLMLKAGSDPWSGGPITPLHLMGGRATMAVPSMLLDERPLLTKRLRFLEEVKRDFWRKWFAQVFDHLVPCPKWSKKYRDVKEGDVVLMRDANVIQDMYKLARVKKAIKGDDGHVRRVLLEYKNVSKDLPLTQTKFRETERSIHNVAVIVPVDWLPADVEDAIVSG